MDEYLNCKHTHTHTEFRLIFSCIIFFLVVMQTKDEGLGGRRPMRGHEIHQILKKNRYENFTEERVFEVVYRYLESRNSLHWFVMMERQQMECKLDLDNFPLLGSKKPRRQCDQSHASHSKRGGASTMQLRQPSWLLDTSPPPKDFSIFCL